MNRGGWWEMVAFGACSGLRRGSSVWSGRPFYATPLSSVASIEAVKIMSFDKMDLLRTPKSGQLQCYIDLRRSNKSNKSLVRPLLCTNRIVEPAW